MNYLLDTNAVIALLKNNPPGVRNRLRRVVSEGASIAVPSVVLYELWYGVARSARQRENAERLRVFLSGTSILFRSTKRMPRLPAICAPRWKQQAPRSAPMTC